MFFLSYLFRDDGREGLDSKDEDRTFQETRVRKSVQVYLCFSFRTLQLLEKV